MSEEAVKPRLCFFDTATLLSMAVDDAIDEVMWAEVAGHTVVVIDIVLSELHRRAGIASTAPLANAALAGLEERQGQWVKIETTRIPLALIAAAQNDVADGRVLIDDDQHLAESTIIAMGRQSAASGASIKVLLSEDYEARRVAATVKYMEAMSTHRVLHRRVHAKLITAKVAAELAGKLHQAGRGPEVTEADFADPTGRRLGRVGHPVT